jgi:hypothetical protein
MGSISDAGDFEFFDLFAGSFGLVFNDSGVTGLRAFGDGVDEFFGIDFDDFGEFSEVLVHLVEVSRFFLVFIVHEFGVDINREGLHRSGHEDAVAVVDVAAAGGDHAGFELLAFGPGEAFGPAVGLQIGHPHGHAGE